ncbi:MAG: response regulator [Candidatus Obscuribacterales bacterium]|nr:response regulator [Candidatus Obscuribacterales bacterium]
MAIKKVLIVDDDPDIRKIGRLSLTGVGRWDVSLASSGKEALQLVQFERPDVILLDINMPDMDGVATLGKLRELPGTQYTAIIMTAARFDQKDVAACVQVGALGVLTKPFNPMTLPEEVQNLVESHH